MRSMLFSGTTAALTRLSFSIYLMNYLVIRTEFYTTRTLFGGYKWAVVSSYACHICTLSLTVVIICKDHAPISTLVIILMVSFFF